MKAKEIKPGNPHFIPKQSIACFLSVNPTLYLISMSRKLSKDIGFDTLKEHKLKFIELTIPVRGDKPKNFMAVGISTADDAAILRKPKHNAWCFTSRDIARSLVRFHDFDDDELSRIIRFYVDLDITFQVKVGSEILDMYRIYRKKK